MSLKLKLSLVLLAVFAGLFAANALVLRVLLWPSFEALEHRSAVRDMGRVEAALGAESNDLLAAAEDWAVWDDAYRFAQDRNAAFARSNLVASVFNTYQLDLLYVIDRQGERIGRAPHPDGEAAMELALLPARLPKDHFLRPFLAGDKGAAGFVATERGPLLLAVHPILNSSHEGAPGGLMVMGRVVTDARVAQWGERVLLDLKRLPPTKDGAGVRLTSETVEAIIDIPAMNGGMAFSLRGTLPREITAEGAKAINYALAALIVTALLVLIAVLVVVQLLAINPLARLAAHVGLLAQTGNLALPMQEERDDELGFLAREFNRMQWRVSRLAFYDTVTDLPNRAMFVEQLRRSLSRAGRSGHRVAVYCVALEEPERGVDTDALVLRAAQWFRANLRGCDVIARLGGLEFAVLVEDLREIERVAVVAAKISHLRDAPIDVEGVHLPLKLQVGASLYPEHGTTPDELLLAADVAMFRAKRTHVSYCLYRDEDHGGLAVSP